MRGLETSSNLRANERPKKFASNGVNGHADSMTESAQWAQFSENI